MPPGIPRAPRRLLQTGMSTIFAPITGPGGAVTVIRLSGPAAFQITESLTAILPPPRQASLKKLRHDGEILDIALVTVFPAPNSFTGEDCAEFSLHGGRRRYVYLVLQAG